MPHSQFNSSKASQQQTLPSPNADASSQLHCSRLYKLAKCHSRRRAIRLPAVHIHCTVDGRPHGKRRQKSKKWHSRWTTTQQKAEQILELAESMQDHTAIGGKNSRSGTATAGPSLRTPTKLSAAFAHAYQQSRQNRPQVQTEAGRTAEQVGQVMKPANSFQIYIARSKLCKDSNGATWLKPSCQRICTE
jgi:hypothetical protein